MKIHRKIRPETIKRIVAGHFGVTEEEMNIGRKRKYMTPKQIAQSLMRELCVTIEGDNPMSFSEIGSHFSSEFSDKLDHASVMHSVKQVNNLMDTDKDYNKTYRYIKWMCLRLSGRDQRDVLINELKMYRELIEQTILKINDLDRFKEIT